MAQHYLAVTSPGLEELLSRELGHFRTRKRNKITGGVEFEATQRGLYQVMAYSRLASRVLLRVDSFRSRDRFELYRKTARLDWSKWIPHPGALWIDASTRFSRMTGTGEIRQVVWDGIQSSLGDRVASGVRLVGKEDSDFVRLVVRLSDNRCTLSLDAAGTPMHRRGWRLEPGFAPLRENVAFALLLALGWRPGVPLVEPMCGSGTFLIEAARFLCRLPPRCEYSYGFHRWPSYQPELWERTWSEGDPQVEKLHAPILEPSGENEEKPPKEMVGAVVKGGASSNNQTTKSLGEEERAEEERGLLFGSDVQSRALRWVQRNATCAEVSEVLEVSQGDVRSLRPPCQRPGIVIANPPYGERIPQQNQRADRMLLQQFAAHFQGWKMGVVMPEDWRPAMPESLQKRLLLSFRNGGIPVRFWEITHAK